MHKAPRTPSRTASIGKAELEVLLFIHEHHPATVRQVADHFAKSRGLVRSPPCLNVMARLCKKGFLARKKNVGVFYYSPKIHRGKLLRDLVGNFVREMLGGSVTPFVAYLAERRSPMNSSPSSKKSWRSTGQRQEKP